MWLGKKTRVGGTVMTEEDFMRDDSGMVPTAVEYATESVLLEAAPALAEDRRIAALEMAVGLVVNRDSGEDAVGITQMADVFLAWLEQGSD